ncbi:MAG: NUDIX domain-containing protein [Pseudomonadota bacterium]
MRRIGEPYIPGIPYRDRIGAYAIIAGRDGHLLLVDEDGELQLPGGGIDPGESPVQAMHREALEETGWRISGLRRIGSFQRYVYIPQYSMWARKSQLIFIARAVMSLGPPTETGHIPLWMPPDVAARRLDIEGDRVMVREAMQRGLI